MNFGMGDNYMYRNGNKKNLIPYYFTILKNRIMFNQNHIKRKINCN